MRLLPKGHSHPYFFKCRGGGFLIILPFDVQMSPPTQRHTHTCFPLACLLCGRANGMALTHTSVLPLLQPQQQQRGNHRGRKEEGSFWVWIQCGGSVVKVIQGGVSHERVSACISVWPILKRPADIRKVVQLLPLGLKKSTCKFARFSSLVL